MVNVWPVGPEAKLQPEKSMIKLCVIDVFIVHKRKYFISRTDIWSTSWVNKYWDLWCVPSIWTVHYASDAAKSDTYIAIIAHFLFISSVNSTFIKKIMKNSTELLMRSQGMGHLRFHYFNSSSKLICIFSISMWLFVAITAPSILPKFCIKSSENQCEQVMLWTVLRPT